MKKQQMQCPFITSMLYNINHGTPPTISKNAYQISIKTLYTRLPHRSKDTS